MPNSTNNSVGNETVDATSLNPREELAKRFAEAGGGLQAAAFAVGLEDHRRMLKEYADRVRDSHKFMAKAANMPTEGTVAGKQSSEKPSASEDDMGGIMVTGDNHYHYTTNNTLPPPQQFQLESPAPSQLQPQMPPISTTISNAIPGMSTMAKVITSTALVAGGGGVGYLASQALTKAPEAKTVTNTSGFNIKLIDPSEIQK